MAGIENQAARLAAEPGDLAHDRAKGLDAVFRFGAGTLSIVVMLIAAASRLVMSMSAPG